MFEERLKQELPEVYNKYLSNKKWFLDRITCILRFKEKSYINKISQLQEKRLFKYLESEQYSKYDIIRYCYYGISQKNEKWNYRGIQKSIAKFLLGDLPNLDEWIDFICSSFYYDSHLKYIEPK